jgi:hypothetical protein
MINVYNMTFHRIGNATEDEMFQAGQTFSSEGAGTTVVEYLLAHSILPNLTKAPQEQRPMKLFRDN